MSAAAEGDVRTTPDLRVRDVEGIRSVPLFDMVVDSDPQLDLGSGPLGRRVLFGSSGLTFHGERLRGEVLLGSGDWSLFRPAGVMTLDVRLSLRTHDGALVLMAYGGRWVTPGDLRADMAHPVERSQVDPARYCFRTNPLCETGSEHYSWLNDIVCIGYGYLVDGGVGRHQVHEIL